MRIYQLILLITLFIFITPNFSKAQDILEWRGIDRTGYFPSTNLLDEWPKDGPELLLQLDDLPNSYSSIVVQDGIMYTTGITDSLEIIQAFYMDGTKKWSTVYGKAWDQSFAPARCTPTIEGEYAYLISGRGDLSCIETGNGSKLWSVNGYKQFGGSWGKWGTAESPLIVDDKLIYTPGGKKTTMVAVDKSNGETVWMSDSLGDNSAYTSPVLLERGELKLIITVTANYVICVNALDGEIFWTFDYTIIDPPKMGGDINPVTPVIVGNEVFVTSGYDHVGIMLEMAADYRSVTLKWKTDVMDVHHGGVVVRNGYLYGANYTSIVEGHWVCLDWENGELQYDMDWKGKGSIIATDDYLICYEERRGNIALVEIGPEEFKIKSTFRVEFGRGPHWSHPTIYDDKLFIRHGEALMVYELGIED